MKFAVVGAYGYHIKNYGGGTHNRALGCERPTKGAGALVQRVEIAVQRWGVHAVAMHERRPPVPAACAVECPSAAAVGGVDRVKNAVKRSDIYPAVVDHGRGRYRAAGGELPNLATVFDAERVDILVQ